MAVEPMTDFQYERLCWLIDNKALNIGEMEYLYAKLDGTAVEPWNSIIDWLRGLPAREEPVIRWPGDGNKGRGPSIHPRSGAWLGVARQVTSGASLESQQTNSEEQ